MALDNELMWQRCALAMWVIVAVACGNTESSPTCSPSAVGQIYERRVEPLLSGGPSSCNQCHLSGVSLGNFVRGNPCQSMACLVELGEVDLDSPLQSKILDRIQRAEPQSTLITAQVIQQEYDGMLEWITYSAQCQTQACGDIADPCGSSPSTAPSKPVASSPLGGCDEGALVSEFERLVWPWRGRCGACHVPYGRVPAPEWVDLTSPERTMYNLLGVKAVDINAPHLSPVLTKPLAMSHPDATEHGGGDKFDDETDATYQDIRQWVELYAACYAKDDYQRPTVNIVSPNAGDWVPAGTSVTLTGSAVDPQEGALSGSALVWSLESSSEPLGTGSTLEVTLPEGRLLLTLTATDSQGNTGSRLIKIYSGGACASEQDRALITDAAAFDQTAWPCFGQCTATSEMKPCLHACMSQSLSSGCADCAAQYLACGSSNCGDVCKEPSNACRLCVTLACGVAWEQCAAVEEPVGLED